MSFVFFEKHSKKYMIIPYIVGKPHLYHLSDFSVLLQIPLSSIKINTLKKKTPNPFCWSHLTIYIGVTFHLNNWLIFYTEKVYLLKAI